MMVLVLLLIVVMLTPTTRQKDLDEYLMMSAQTRTIEDGDYYGRGSTKQTTCDYEGGGLKFNCFRSSIDIIGTTPLVVEVSYSNPRVNYYNEIGNYIYPFELTYLMKGKKTYYKFSNKGDAWFTCGFNGCGSRMYEVPAEGIITINRENISSYPTDRRGYTYLYLAAWDLKELSYEIQELIYEDTVYNYQQVRVAILLNSIAQCSEDYHCGSYLGKCNPRGLCEMVECVGIGDCGEKQLCIRNTCVDVGCTQNYHCAKGYCDDAHNRYVCVDCFHDYQCGDRGVCKDYKCQILDCTSDIHCGGLGVCVENVCRPVQCFYDLHCTNPQANFCDQNNRCVNCFNDDHCGDKSICWNNRCREVDCKTDDDCENNYYCDTKPILNECLPDWAAVGFVDESVVTGLEDDDGRLNTITLPFTNLFGKQEVGQEELSQITSDLTSDYERTSYAVYYLLAAFFIILFVVYYWRNKK